MNTTGYYTEDTIAAIATPPGKGAIGVIKISGEEALNILRKIFKPFKSREEFESHKMYYGHIVDPEKGKIVYYANCISCHNYNPKKPGSIGPQIYRSSKELLSKKINFGIYPKNYKPKRSTKIMPLLPHLDKEIANLHAFLNAP